MYSFGDVFTNLIMKAHKSSKQLVSTLKYVQQHVLVFSNIGLVFAMVYLAFKDNYVGLIGVSSTYFYHDFPLEIQGLTTWGYLTLSDGQKSSDPNFSEMVNNTAKCYYKTAEWCLRVSKYLKHQLRAFQLHMKLLWILGLETRRGSLACLLTWKSCKNFMSCTKLVAQPGVGLLY